MRATAYAQFGTLVGAGFKPARFGCEEDSAARRTDNPHISAEHVSAEKFEQILKPGMVIMAEPNPITPDGLFGIFLGHTFIVTDSGHEVVDDFPLEIAVAKS